MKTNILFIVCLSLISCRNEVKHVQSDFNNSEDSEFRRKKKKKYSVENIGDTLDVENGVYVFYNKSINNTSGRNLTKDGYNLGLKWQCVEFVKRYYFERFNHKMPNSYGHAKDFFNSNVLDGKRNSDRNLLQFSNRSAKKPQVDDLVIFDGNLFNPYGHVAIVSQVTGNNIEIVQQNVGKKTRDNFRLKFENGKWTITDSSILGWLRKE